MRARAMEQVARKRSTFRATFQTGTQGLSLKLNLSRSLTMSTCVREPGKRVVQVRPPTRLRASSSSTRQPASHASRAQTSPASPPPTTTRSHAGAWSLEPSPEPSPNEPTVIASLIAVDAAVTPRRPAVAPPSLDATPKLLTSRERQHFQKQVSLCIKVHPMEHKTKQYICRYIL